MNRAAAESSSAAVSPGVCTDRQHQRAGGEKTKYKTYIEFHEILLISPCARNSERGAIVPFRTLSSTWLLVKSFTPRRCQANDPKPGLARCPDVASRRPCQAFAKSTAIKASADHLNKASRVAREPTAPRKQIRGKVESGERSASNIKDTMLAAGEDTPCEYPTAI